MLLLIIMLAQTPAIKSSCRPMDFQCLQAEMDDAVRIIQDTKARKRRPIQPQCPMWVTDAFNVECV